MNDCSPVQNVRCSLYATEKVDFFRHKRKLIETFQKKNPTHKNVAELELNIKKNTCGYRKEPNHSSLW